MTEFTKEVCWKTKEIPTFVTDDVAALTDAQLLATHQPAKIRRRPLGERREVIGTEVDEAELLAAFLQPSADRVFMPIIGEPGTGKSRLVRWLRAQVPPQTDRRVVYVHKHHTSLRDVILLVLNEMEEEHAAPLRKALKESHESLREEAVPDLLIDRIAVVMEHHKELWGKPEDPGYRERAGVGKRFPQVLRDPAYREWFLRKDGLIAGFVKNALKGSMPGDEHREFQFTTEEMPDRSPNRGINPNVEVQDYLDTVIATDEDKQVVAALLTDALGPAIQAVFGITGSASLLEVMRQTRHALAKQNVELVILVEDFAKIQAIQRDLLEALVEPPIVEGKRQLCNIRVALAVTRGYFEPLQGTFLSRAAFNCDEYVLDAPYGDEEEGQTWGTDEVAQFVGRYLNVIRVGEVDVETDFQAADAAARPAGRWVRSHCTTCPYQAPCFAAFGSVLGPDRGDEQEAFGLYPFNADALDVLTRATIGPKVDGKEVFDPRRLLSKVVKATTQQYAKEIEEGNFPSKAYADQFSQGIYPLPIVRGGLQERLAKHDATEQAVALIRIWGKGRAVLPPGVYEAFGLEPYEVEQERETEQEKDRKWRETRDTGGTRKKEKKEKEKGEKSDLEVTLDLLTSWQLGDKHIDSSLAHRIRQLLYAAVLQRVNWDALGLPEKPALLVDPIKGLVLRNSSFDIEKAEGGRQPNQGNVEFPLKPGLDDLLFLQAAVRLGYYRHVTYEEGAQDYRRFRVRIDRWAGEVSSRCADLLKGSESPLVAPLEALVIGSRLLGLPGSSGNDPVELLEIALQDVPTVPPASADSLSVLRADAARYRKSLQEHILGVVGLRQGAGPTRYGVKAGLLLRIIERLIPTWSISGTTDSLETGPARHVRELDKRLDAALNAELDYLAAWQAKVGLVLGAHSRDEICKRLTEAMDAALSASVFETDYNALRASRDQVLAISWRPVEDIPAVLAVDRKDRVALLSALGPERRRTLSAIEDFVDKANRFLTRSSERAAIVCQDTQTGGGHIRRVTAALDAVDHVLETLEQSP